MNVAATCSAGDGNTVRAILNARLCCVRDNAVRSTRVLAKRFLTSFSAVYGNLQIQQLKEWHMEQSLTQESQPRLNPATSVPPHGNL